MDGKKCIVIIEDELVVQQSLVETLNMNNFEVFAYDTAEEMLNSDIISCADAIIMDIGLPGISGWEATSLIKKRYPLIPVVMLTAYSEVNYRDTTAKRVSDNFGGAADASGRLAVPERDQHNAILERGTSRQRKALGAIPSLLR